MFAEPLAAACQVLDQIHVRPTDRVAVLGDGKLGMLVAQVLALTGCASRWSATPTQAGIWRTRYFHLPDAQDLKSSAAWCRVHRPPQGFQIAHELVRPRGTVVLKSTYHGLAQADLSTLAVNEVSVVGSRCGPFPAALRLLSRNLVDVASLVEAIYPLDQALAAFEHAGRRGALKVLVRVADPTESGLRTVPSA